MNERVAEYDSIRGASADAVTDVHVQNDLSHLARLNDKTPAPKTARAGGVVTHEFKSAGYYTQDRDSATA